MTSRKRQLVEDDDASSLIVVGYGARLFNPASISETDAQISSVSLPWDENTEVDRFDCRLLLTHAPSPAATTVEDDDDIDFEEKYACDEERYRDLELYSDNSASNGKKPADPPIVSSSGPIKKLKKEPDVEKPFVPPKNLFFPGGMVLPSTEKIGLLIEKTAQFVAKSDFNSEEKIVERAKTTPSLSFLLPNDTLYEYYKFIKFLIKDGLYQTVESTDVVSDDSGDDDYYISPLLMRPKTNSVVGPQSQAPRKPSVRVQKPAPKPTEVPPTELDLIKYFSWYNKFYDQPSPYYPNVTPRVFTPAKSLQDIIAGHVTEVLANGHRHEQVIKERDSKNSAHFDFKSPYYMYYQNMLYKRHAEKAPPAPVPFSTLVTALPTPPTLNNTLPEFDTGIDEKESDVAPEPTEDVILRRQLAHEAMNRILKNKKLK